LPVSLPRRLSGNLTNQQTTIPQTDAAISLEAKLALEKKMKSEKMKTNFP